MNTGRLLGEPMPMRPWFRFWWPWAAFWLLMLVVGLQDYIWSGGRHFWQPFVDYGTSALTATAVVVIQMRRACRFDSLLGHPRRWFIHMWAWMPLQLVAYIVGTYGLRIGLYTLAGSTLRHGPWPEVIAYEATKFVLFYALFGGIHFGLRSYRAWVAERLRAEKQANLVRQAQLAQLTQQLQPHFLFNALNTISSLIHDDPDSADLLLTRLATLLRAATDASQRPEQSFADELTLLHAYADIMSQRFADRVQIRWDIDASARDCRVPTFGLQPLLENCFRHVVERRSAPTRIAIRAACGAGTLQIEIEDDGDLQQLPARRGVGLSNLEDRLESLYGTHARLELRLRPGGGLVARVSLPCAC
jgi:two-component system, LytTR family, sensor kinase